MSTHQTWLLFEGYVNEYNRYGFSQDIIQLMVQYNGNKLYNMELDFESLSHYEYRIMVAFIDDINCKIKTKHIPYAIPRHLSIKKAIQLILKWNGKSLSSDSYRNNNWRLWKWQYVINNKLPSNYRRIILECDNQKFG